MAWYPGFELYNQRLKIVAGALSLNMLALIVLVEEPSGAPVVTPIILEDPPQGGVSVGLGVKESVGVKLLVGVPVRVRVGVRVGLLLGVRVGVSVGVLLGVRVAVVVKLLVGVLVAWEKAKAGKAKTHPRFNNVARR
jgi:hypothetical protein